MFLDIFEFREEKEETFLGKTVLKMRSQRLLALSWVKNKINYNRSCTFFFKGWFFGHIGTKLRLNFLNDFP